MSVSFIAGQLPPVFVICLIISFLWLRSFLHLNIKWSTVCSSSSQGHTRLSVSPSLYKYAFMLPCPVVCVGVCVCVCGGGGVCVCVQMSL